MRFACWLPKATNTQTDYVILIAFAWQQWLRERASMLLYTYIAIGVWTAEKRRLQKPSLREETTTAKTPCTYLQ